MGVFLIFLTFFFPGGRVDPNKLKTLLLNIGLNLKNKELKSVMQKQAASGEHGDHAAFGCWGQNLEIRYKNF